MEAQGHKVLIDPGISLGFTRWGLHPHPIQAAAGDIIRKEIIEAWRSATDIVVSHPHGDHIPLPDANPFQLHLRSVIGLNDDAKIWIIGGTYALGRARIRLEALEEAFHGKVVEVERDGLSSGPISFHGPVPHGEGSHTMVMLTMVDYGDGRVLHVPDTQLTSKEAVETILTLKPDVVVTDGPALYRYIRDPWRTRRSLEKAKMNLELMSRIVDMVIVDHHLLRCNEGLAWLRRVRRKIKHHDGSTILTAAEYMGRPLLMLEAWRRTLYKVFPIDDNWFIPSQHYEATLKNYVEIYFKLLQMASRYPCLDEGTLAELLEDRDVNIGDAHSHRASS